VADPPAVALALIGAFPQITIPPQSAFLAVVEEKTTGLEAVPLI